MGEDFLDKFKYHSIFSIGLNNARSTEPGQPYCSLFQCYTSEEFKQAMLEEIQANVKESDEHRPMYEKLQAEISSMKVTAAFKDTSVLCCIHSDFKVSIQDMDIHLRYGIGIKNIKKFIDDSKLSC